MNVVIYSKFNNQCMQLLTLLGEFMIMITLSSARGGGQW
jgi:hypothetical protein